MIDKHRQKTPDWIGLISVFFVAVAAIAAWRSSTASFDSVKITADIQREQKFLDRAQLQISSSMELYDDPEKYYRLQFSEVRPGPNSDDPVFGLNLIFTNTGRHRAERIHKTVLVFNGKTFEKQGKDKKGNHDQPLLPSEKSYSFPFSIIKGTNLPPYIIYVEVEYFDPILERTFKEVSRLKWSGVVKDSWVSELYFISDQELKPLIKHYPDWLPSESIQSIAD